MFPVIKLVMTSKVMVGTITWLTVIEYLRHKWPRICFASRNGNPILSFSWLPTGFEIRVTRRVALA